MADILFLAGTNALGGAPGIDEPSLPAILESEGHIMTLLPLFERAPSTHTLTGSKPPAVVVVDVRESADLLPVRHLRRTMSETWGDDIAPPCLAILARRHLAQPDWLALVDDFLLWPIDGSEVAARVRLLLFRRRFVSDGDSMRYAGTRLQISGSQAYDDKTGRSIQLTPREFELLRFLMTHRGKYFGRERLLDMVWGVDFTGGQRTVDIHIRRLRSKLPAQTADLLETRRTLGYGFGASHDSPR